jgi:tubulin polyglutamylase TTLL6/13
VTSLDPLKVFIYKEGMARFATQKYDLSVKDNYGDQFMHLTNYAINKENKEYKKGSSAETGHKKTLEDIWAQLREDGLDVDSIKLEVEAIVVKTIMSVRTDLLHNYRTCQPSDLEGDMCFEILGFDIFIDKNGKPWLIEVNLSPSFYTDSEFDK